MTERSTIRPSRRGVLAAGGSALAAAVAGCASDSGGAVDADATVSVGPNGSLTFEPGTEDPLRVTSGATVAFVWKSGSHNVVVESQPDGANWDGHAGIESEGFSFSHTFEVPGTYEYYCEPHEALGMVGTLVVEE